MLKLLRKLLLLLLIFAVVAIAVTFFLSPQTTKEFIGSDGKKLTNSIAEIRTVNINGVAQRLLIRGKDTRNPILLHLHGGPGGADQAIIRASGKTIEDLFTVVYWDQRGAGASYTSAITPEMLTLEQIVSDGIELSSQLKQEFAKDKIYLEAHSWGTLVAVHMITQRPDLYQAYFGIGQIANSKRAEFLSYNYALSEAIKATDSKTIAGLKEIGSPPYKHDQAWVDKVMIERGLMQPYEIPGQEQLLSMFDIYQNFIFYPEYSVKDKLNALTGSKVSLQALWIEAVNADLFKTHLSVNVPVYIFQGKYDMHTVTEVAKDYFDRLSAPHKEYFLFENSAHWPQLREHQKYRELLQRIIQKNEKDNTNR